MELRSHSRRAACRILVVEDEALVGTTVTEGLLECGFRVRWATTGDDALALLRAGHAIDALVTDIHLGEGMDGFLLAEQVRKLFPNAAVLYVSGRWAVLDHLRAVPGARLMPKPCTPGQIAAALRDLLLGGSRHDGTARTSPTQSNRGGDWAADTPA